MIECISGSHIHYSDPRQEDWHFESSTTIQSACLQPIPCHSTITFLAVAARSRELADTVSVMFAQRRELLVDVCQFGKDWAPAASCALAWSMQSGKPTSQSKPRLFINKVMIIQLYSNYHACLELVNNWLLGRRQASF